MAIKNIFLVFYVFLFFHFVNNSRIRRQNSCLNTMCSINILCKIQKIYMHNEKIKLRLGNTQLKNQDKKETSDELKDYAAYKAAVTSVKLCIEHRSLVNLLKVQKFILIKLIYSRSIVNCNICVLGKLLDARFESTKME